MGLIATEYIYVKGKIKKQKMNDVGQTQNKTKKRNPPNL